MITDSKNSNTIHEYVKLVLSELYPTMSIKCRYVIARKQGYK